MHRPADLSRRTLLAAAAAAAAATAATASTLPAAAAAAGGSGGWERSLPRVRRYPTFTQLSADVRALAAAHPGRVRREILGHSRAGRPIPVLTVGRGRRDVLVLGGPHPNEPVGFLTAPHLVRLAATRPELAEELDVTWHVVPCIDPDAMVLGQGWYDRPLTVGTYHRHFYRPEFTAQVEWTFPVPGAAGRPLPETLLLARLIDDLRPAMVYSLHNADFTGAFTLLTRPEPDLVRTLGPVLAERGFPLHAAGADGGGEPLGPGTSLVPGPLPSGASSVHHAARHGALGVVTELPLWRIPEAGDATASPQTYGPLLEAAADDHERDATLLAELRAQVAALVPEDSPLLRAATESLELVVGAAGAYRRAAAGAEGARRASVAERHLLRIGRYTPSLRVVGMLLQAVRDVPGGRRPARRLEEELRTRSARLEALAGPPVEPRALVAAQLAVGFAAAAGLRG